MADLSRRGRQGGRADGLQLRDTLLKPLHYPPIADGRTDGRGEVVRESTSLGSGFGVNNLLSMLVCLSVLSAKICIHTYYMHEMETISEHCNDTADDWRLCYLRHRCPLVSCQGAAVDLQ